MTRESPATQPPAAHAAVHKGRRASASTKLSSLQLGAPPSHSTGLRTSRAQHRLARAPLRRTGRAPRLPPRTRARQSAAMGGGDSGKRTTGRMLGSAVAGFSELALFHPVDTVAKRLMTKEVRTSSRAH